MNNEPDVGYLSIPQAAARIGVNRSAVYQAIAAGNLTPVRVLGKNALRVADVDAYARRTYMNRIRNKPRHQETNP